MFSTSRGRSLAATSLRLMFLPAILILIITLAISVDAQDPLVHRKEFANQPGPILWFEDSDTVLVADREAGEVWMSDNGGVDWQLAPLEPKGEVSMVLLNPNSNQHAVVLGNRNTHWITTNQGKSWEHFTTELNAAIGFGMSPISWHGTDPKKVILNTWKVAARGASEREAIYTQDAFKTHHTLKKEAKQCQWAQERPEFELEKPSDQKNRALCIVRGESSSREDQNRLFISDDFFEHSSEPELEDDRPLPGVLNLVATTKFIIVARRTERSDELAIYTTIDSQNWHRALFSQEKLVANGFTVMESTNYSIHIDVMVPNNNPGRASQMGMLFTSNSEGTNFLRNEDFTNRNEFGIVDFEKVQNVQGVYLTNIVTNPRAISEEGAEKIVSSRITFDDGRTFQPLRPKMDQDKEVQLHSVTDLSNSGRVYSTPSPGLLLGIGSVGNSLRPYEQSDMFISEDGGLTWRNSLTGPHKYEVGDQGSLIVAVWDHDDCRRVIYSLDRGKSWPDLHFIHEPEGGLTPLSLTTVPDSTGKKFVLLGYQPRGSNKNEEGKYLLFTLDFNPLDLPTCKSSDFEEWTARYDPKRDNSTCIMGHTQVFSRRKADAKCFVNRKYHEAEPDTENCPCSAADFECDYGFLRSSDKERCEPVGDNAKIPKDQCKNDETTYQANSGFRLIPGNTCTRRNGISKDEEKVDRPCNGTAKSDPEDGAIGVKITDNLDADSIGDVVYLEYNSAFDRKDDETIFMTTGDNELYVTHDHGFSWASPPTTSPHQVLATFPNRYTKNHAYFLTPTETVFYTLDRGYSFHSFDAPSSPNPQYPALRFHETQDRWLLWTGCVRSNPRNCEPGVWRSTDGGDSWILMRRGVENCEFIYRRDRDGDNEELERRVFCVWHPDENLRSKKTLAASNDWFEHNQQLFDNILNFATMSEFIIVAKRNEDENSLTLDCSVDSLTFADAKWPKTLPVEKASGFTVLDSSTHSVFLHITVNNQLHAEYGSIVKSNSNGTQYAMSLPNVNRDMDGYADFEKSLGLEGVAVANVIINAEEVDGGALKKLKSKISHNDGADWIYLPAPAIDNEDKKYGCDVSNVEKCSLHLHGYTARADARDTFSSPSAVGMMIGIGTVGETLGKRADSDTFVSRDGGITWRTALKGPHMWEFGDQGSVIVLVQDGVPTREIWYSLDYGDSWKRKHFSEDKDYKINDITTLPSDGSLKFLLWGVEPDSYGQPVTVALDFSHIYPRQCELSLDNVGKADADYEYFIPQHPTQKNDCLFGHVTKYIRRKQNADCYNGKTMNEIDKMHRQQNCECKNIDFECDFNYVRANDGSCVFAEGSEPYSPASECFSDSKPSGYREVTGYRKIPLDTCENGNEMELLGRWHACPGREADFERDHPRRGISGAGLFFAIVIPIAAAAGIGYFLYRRYEGNFGRIRLGDGMGFSSSNGAASGTGGLRTSSRFDIDHPVVRWPVAILSGAAAVVMVIPSVLGGLFRAVSERIPGRRRGAGGLPTARYTSRGSFARSRGTYQSVRSDEADLLGEESDEE